jgi:hypothetical protein
MPFQYLYMLGLKRWTIRSKQFEKLNEDWPFHQTNLFSSMPPFTALASLAVLLCTRVLATSSINTKTYEYIVVGSGPGGGPIASNLARAGHAVLLIEAGYVDTS